MALRLLTLAAVAALVAANSVSHVSFSFGNQAPISYEVRPDSTHHSHPPPRYPTPAPPKYTTPPPPKYTTPPPPKYTTRPPPKYTTPPPPKYTTPPPPKYTTAPPPPKYTTTPPQKYTTPPPPYYPSTPARVAYNPPQLTYPPPTTSPAPTYPPTTTTPAPTYPPTTTTTKAPIYHNPQPAYHPRPSHQPRPSYHPTPSYKPAPSYGHPEPACAALTNSTWCLEDEEYPEYEIKHAIEYHLEKFNSLYADVAELDTELSVERPKTLEEETYLCPSETAYIRPLRAQNTDGKWRVIVNNIQLHYKTFTQTTRIEECLTAGEDCPKVPMCYESKCLQKSIYHRFLVYDSYDKYFPFAIETFKLPASCACLLGAYTIDH